jgi:hypothetical protein
VKRLQSCRLGEIGRGEVRQRGRVEAVCARAPTAAL